MVTHAGLLSLPVDCKGMCNVSKLLHVFPHDPRGLHVLKCNYVKQFGN